MTTTKNFYVNYLNQLCHRKNVELSFHSLDNHKLVKHEIGCYLSSAIPTPRLRSEKYMAMPLYKLCLITHFEYFDGWEPISAVGATQDYIAGEMLKYNLVDKWYYFKSDLR